MFDRLFFPALVFAVLVAATGAFAIDVMRGAAPSNRAHVVQLERVVIVAERAATAPTLAADAIATSAEPRVTAVR